MNNLTSANVRYQIVHRDGKESWITNPAHGFILSLEPDDEIYGPIPGDVWNVVEHPRHKNVWIPAGSYAMNWQPTRATVDEEKGSPEC